jgi:hypothetical protein
MRLSGVLRRFWWLGVVLPLGLVVLTVAFALLVTTDFSHSALHFTLYSCYFSSLVFFFGTAKLLADEHRAAAFWCVTTGFLMGLIPKLVETSLGWDVEDRSPAHVLCIGGLVAVGISTFLLHRELGKGRTA